MEKWVRMLTKDYDICFQLYKRSVYTLKGEQIKAPFSDSPAQSSHA